MTYYPIIISSRISKGYGYTAGGSGGTSTTEKYDDVANTWTIKASLNTGLSRINGFSLNNYGYVAGGLNVTYQKVTEKHDDVANTWTAKANLNTARGYVADFSLNGHGYVAGGSTPSVTNVVEKYDDVLNTWTTKATLITAKTSSSGFSLNGYGYIAGGYVAADTNVTEKYDDIANNWTVKANLNIATSSSKGFSLNAYGYVSGSGALTEKYDDITNTWTAKANLNTARNLPGSFSLNGYGYLATGTGATTEKYDDVLNTWTVKANVNTTRTELAGFSLGNLQQSIQNPNIREIIEANRRLRSNESMVTKVASANARNTHNAETTTTSATYTKQKTITFHLGLRGGYRVLFDLKTSDIARTAYGRIYRNGVALGTEQSEAAVADTYVTKSEDLTKSLSPGDTLELWLHNDGTGTTTARNFQIAYDDSPTVATSSSNL